MIARSMATRWAMTSIASATVLCVLAQRAIWLRLLPMRVTCRVRSRSTSAAGALARREGRRRASPPPECGPQGGIEGAESLASPCRGPAKRGPKG